MKRVLFIFIQWIWGFPQNAAGVFLYLLKKHANTGGTYRYAQVIHWDRKDSLSLGMFLFIGTGCGMRIIKHEYGHTIQSLILGPFYLILVGIPSYIWCHFPGCKKQWLSGKVSYFSRYPENWADRLGHVEHGEEDDIKNV